jgi:hypothetical protein
MKTNPKETKKRKLQLSKKTIVALTNSQTQGAWGGKKTSGYTTCPTHVSPGVE